MAKTVWFPIKNVEMINPHYQIVPDTYEFSNHWSIRNKKTGNLITINPTSRGGSVTLKCDYVSSNGSRFISSYFRAKFSVKNIIYASLTGNNVFGNNKISHDAVEKAINAAIPSNF